MKTLLQANRLVIVPDTADEQQTLASWKASHENFAFVVVPNTGSGSALQALGPRAEACREPINVTSTSPAPVNLIANFAPTPFVLDGMTYSCIEAFWQGLRVPLEDRTRIAVMDGAAAKREGASVPYGAFVSYGGRSIPVGTYEHWQLMFQACRAKFQQNAHAREALLATRERPLTHRVRRDSRTIPGVVMAEIWMKLRSQFRKQGD